jgi:nitrogen-specific signal transduction histidine kinase
MPANRTFSFTPSARLQRFLGNELIADPNLAIIEFVKNAYDAGAANVEIDFKIAELPLDQSTLTISDDGIGMSESSFETNWMHPGFSLKSAEATPAPPNRRRNAASKRQSNRVPVGEKGLGRLAAGRLGETLEVFTRESSTDPWLHVFFDWREFEDMHRALHEIRIPYDLLSSPNESPGRTGTLIIIRGLKQKWDARITGRPLAGRSRTRLGRLKQDLELLIRPLSALDQDFTIQLLSDSIREDTDIGTITPRAAVDAADYRYSFEFRVLRNGKTKIQRELHRSKEISQDLGGPRIQKFDAIALEEELPNREELVADTQCGPFTGTFLYSPPPAARRAKEIDAVGSGVLLYRDGVIVEPYGLEANDWVGVAARKASRQGYALVQPSTFSGYVLISRDANPSLRDMSNREGLLRSEESEAFISHVRSEFRNFEGLIYEELAKRWEAKEEKAARSSATATATADVRLRAVAHSLGQPLLGLTADIAALKSVARRSKLNAAARNALIDIATSADGHLDNANTILRRFLDIRPIQRTEVSVNDIIDDVVTECRSLARSLGAKLLVTRPNPRKIFVAQDLVFEGLKEIVNNALEAPRPPDREPEVRLLSHESEDGDLVIDVIDNALGIRGAKSNGPLSAIPSTKGRPGQGLATVETIIQATAGNARIARSDKSGTHFEIYLPDLLSGLRTGIEK